MTRDDLLAYLQRRTHEIGDCWVWTGAAQKAGGAPVMRMGKSTINVRPLVYKTLIADNIRPGNLVITTCGERGCVNPDHLTQTTRKKLQKKLAQHDYHANPLRREKLRQAALKRSKITQEIADQIRASEGSQREIGLRFGLSQACVSKIMRYESWASPSNIFMRLVA